MSIMHLEQSDLINIEDHPNKYKVASFFAGVGGIDLGFEQTGKFKTVYANEIDQNAAITYKLNFGDKILTIDDISNVDPYNLPKVDIITSGFPCQAFSIAGYRKGFEDDRGHLFFETMRIVDVLQPKVIFLENVKNLVSHDNGNTFNVIKKTLEESGYFYKYAILNGKDYGNVPQNRERIYIVGFKESHAYENFEFPKPIELRKKLSDVVDFVSKDINDCYYYSQEKNFFYDLLKKDIVSSDTVYQWRRKYVRENQSGVCPTLTANMGTGGHNVPLIKVSNGIRKLTERECFNIQGFPNNFDLPNIAKSHLYKQAGNSVIVPVIRRIANNIANALEINAYEANFLEYANF